MKLSLRRHGSSVVVGHAAVRQPGDHRVDDHVAGAGIKGKDLIQRTVRRKYGHVADAADVLQGYPFVWTAVQQEFGVRHQRRAQSARRHVPDAKIAHHRAAEAFCQQRVFAQL